MTFKKVLSVIMAGAMVLSMGMTAFATGTPSGQLALEGEEAYEIEIGSSTQVATIKVQVPEVVGFIVNPYKLEAKNDEIGITTTGNTQIVSPVQKIVNKSDFKIKVGGTIFAFENNPEEAKLVASPTSVTAGNPTPKEATIRFLAKADTTSSTVTHLTTADTPDQNVELSTAKTDTGVTLGTAVELDKVDTGNSVYLFNFDGTATEAPTNSWTDADTFGATIAFTFTAVANAGTPAATKSASITSSLDPATLDSTTNNSATLTVALQNAGTDTIASVVWSMGGTGVVTLGGSTTATEMVTYAGVGTETITATVTTADGDTLTATFSVTCS